MQALPVSNAIRKRPVYCDDTAVPELLVLFLALHAAIPHLIIALGQHILMHHAPSNSRMRGSTVSILNIMSDYSLHLQCAMHGQDKTP